VEEKIITICFPVENIDIKKLYKDKLDAQEAQGVLIKSGHPSLAKSLDTSIAVIEKLIEHYSSMSYNNHWVSTGVIKNEED
jgi:hypothetical protein